MPRPYCGDLRERVLLACEQGEGSRAAIARRFRVGESTIYTWLQVARTEGRRAAKPHAGGPPPKLDAVDRVRRKIDYEEYGGVPVLGVNGVSVICHGSSHAKAIKNAIRVALQTADAHLPERISEGVRQLQESQMRAAEGGAAPKTETETGAPEAASS